MTPDWTYLAMKESIELCDFLWKNCMSPGIAKNPSPFKEGMEHGKFVVHVKQLRYEIETRRPLGVDDERITDNWSPEDGGGSYETPDELDQLPRTY